MQGERMQEREVIIFSKEIDASVVLKESWIKAQNRAGEGKFVVDNIEGLLSTFPNESFFYFTNKGKIYEQKDLSFVPSTEDCLTHVCATPLTYSPQKDSLVIVTKKGIVKKTNISSFYKVRAGGIIAINLDEGDSIADTCIVNEDSNIIIATKHGKALKFSAKQVRELGRVARGVVGIRLRNGDEVIGVETVDDSLSLLTVTENGYGKRTSVSCYNSHDRCTFGQTNIKTSERNGDVVGIKLVAEEDEVLIASENGYVIRLRAADVPSTGRSTQGVKLQKLGEGDKVTSIERIINVVDTEE